MLAEDLLDLMIHNLSLFPLSCLQQDNQQLCIWQGAFHLARNQYKILTGTFEGTF
jgi:hypothetical protein